MLFFKKTDYNPKKNYCTDFKVLNILIQIKLIAMKITIGEYLISQLSNYGVNMMFGVPGDYTLSFLDIVEDSKYMQWIGCCNELNASYAADGYARINGMGALSITYGVGALSAVNGVAGSFAENVPVVIISGRPSEQTVENKALVHHSLGNGEFDIFYEMFSKVTYDQAIITERYARRQIDDILYKCYVEKLPVYIELCSDLAKMEIEIEDNPITNKLIPTSRKEVLQQFIKDVEDILRNSANQMIIADYEVLRYNLTDKVNKLVEKAKVPATTLNMGKGAFDETSIYYAGLYAGILEDKKVNDIVMNTDCALLIGAKLTDSDSGLKNPNPNMQFIIVNPFYCKIGNKTYNNIFIGDVIDELSKLSYHSDLIIPQSSISVAPATDQELTQVRLYELFEQYIKGDAIIIAEQGTSFFGISTMRLPINTSFIGQPLWGSIGYTLPATLGAALADRSRRTYLLIGDGSLQFTVQEISTMLKLKLNCVILVDNNNGYTVEKVIHGMHREYNAINMWEYSKLPDVLNKDKSAAVTIKVSSEKDLMKAFDICDRNPEKLILIELILPEFDMPEFLENLAKILNAQNHY